MNRAVFSFSLAAVLSVVTMYGMAEHRYDMLLVLPVGLYFIVAFLLSFRPAAGRKAQWQFGALALVIWLVLFGVSYNLLFMFIAPVAGGLGAWLICWLSERFLAMKVEKVMPIIIAGVLGAVIGLIFMVLGKDLPREVFTIGCKAGLVAAGWQLAVGMMLARDKQMGL